MMFSHETLENYYQTNFALMKYHNYSLTELEEMYPFEREIYLILVENWVREEKEKQKQRQR